MAGLFLLRKSSAPSLPPEPTFPKLAPKKPAAAPEPEKLYAGDKVMHDKFGAGTVVSPHPQMPRVHFPYAPPGAPTAARIRAIGHPVPRGEVTKFTPPQPARSVAPPKSISFSLGDDAPAPKKAPSGWGDADTSMEGLGAPKVKPGGTFRPVSARAEGGFKEGDTVTHPGLGVGTVVNDQGPHPRVYFPYASKRGAPSDATDPDKGLEIRGDLLKEHLREKDTYDAPRVTPREPLPPGSFVRDPDRGLGRVVRDDPVSGSAHVHFPDDREHIAAYHDRDEVPPVEVQKAAVTLVKRSREGAAPERPALPAGTKVPQPTQEQFAHVHDSLQGHLEDIDDRYGLGGPQQIADTTHHEMRRVLDNSRMVTRMPMGVLPKVLDEGLQNQHATARSGGMFDPAVRQRAEGHMFGIPAGSHHSEYPTYGYLEPKDQDQRGMDLAARNYGNAKAILKDHMRHRSTFTVGDSLNGALQSRHLPAPMDAPHWTAADSHVGTVVTRNHEPVGKQLTSGAYWETQMHGGVTHHDIDSVEFDHEPTPEVQRALADKGIPWKHNK